MQTAVVAKINFLENVLEQKTVQVPQGATWKDAFMEAFINGTVYETDAGYINFLNGLSDNLGECLEALSDAEMAVQVSFIQP